MWCSVFHSAPVATTTHNVPFIGSLLHTLLGCLICWHVSKLTKDSWHNFVWICGKDCVCLDHDTRDMKTAGTTFVTDNMSNPVVTSWSLHWELFMHRLTWCCCACHGTNPWDRQTPQWWDSCWQWLRVRAHLPGVNPNPNKTGANRRPQWHLQPVTTGALKLRSTKTVGTMWMRPVCTHVNMISVLNVKT